MVAATVLRFILLPSMLAGQLQEGMPSSDMAVI